MIMEDLVLMVILFYSCVYTLSVRTHSCRTLSELVKSKWGFSKVGLLGRKLPLVLLMLRSSCVWKQKQGILCSKEKFGR